MSRPKVLTQDATVCISWVCVWRCGWCLQITVFHQTGLVSGVLSVFLCLQHAVFWLTSPLLDFFTRYNINSWLKLCKNRWVKNKHSSAETTSHVPFVIYIAYMIRKGSGQKINTNRDWSLGPQVRAEATHTKINARMINNGYANPSSAKVPSFKRSLYIIHSVWSRIVSAFCFFLHSSLSCSVQPSNWSASCTLNESLLNFCILIWGKCKMEAESSTSPTF